jgi:ferritin-like metal-binding protein YciE
MKLESMQDVLVNQLRDLYNAEKQLTKALPKMAKAARSEALSQAFTEHLEETEKQIERLDQVFEHLGKRAQGKQCHGMEGLIKEGDEAMEAEGEDALVDTEIIAAAQRIEHYEIAAYGCVAHYAELMGLDDVAKLLNESLEEEEAADQKLTAVNQDEISEGALAAGTAGVGAESGSYRSSARSGAMGSADDGSDEDEPDSIGSSMPTKRADGSTRGGQENARSSNASARSSNASGRKTNGSKGRSGNGGKSGGSSGRR